MVNFLIKLKMALSGDSFCQSAHDAFYLILRNAGRIAVTHGRNLLIYIYSG